MNLRPEQERALAYVRKHGTGGSIAEIRSRLMSTYQAFERLVAPVPPELARKRPAPSVWSVQEVVDHALTSDARAFDQLRDVLSGRPSEAPIPAGLQSPSPLLLAWDVLLEDFGRVHREIVSLLDATPEETPQRASAAVEMVVKCAGDDGVLTPIHWIEKFDCKAFALLIHIHNREHVAQTERILAAFEAAGCRS